jgi:hypothetical protein
MTNFFEVAYLTTLSVLRLWNVNYRMTGECECDDGMITGRRNRSNVSKPAPVPLCIPKIPYSVSWDRIRAATVVDNIYVWSCLFLLWVGLCIYLCVYVCTYVFVYVCMHVCVYVCMHVCICVCMYICICVCVYVCMYLCMYISVYMYMCVCIKIQIMTKQVAFEMSTATLHTIYCIVLIVTVSLHISVF